MSSRVTISLIALALAGAVGLWVHYAWIDNVGWATYSNEGWGLDVVGWAILGQVWPLVLIAVIVFAAVAWFCLDKAAEARAIAICRAHDREIEQRRKQLDQSASRLDQERHQLRQEYNAKMNEAQQAEEAARASQELSEREAAESRGAVRRMEKLLQRAEKRRENATAAYARKKATIGYQEIQQ